MHYDLAGFCFCYFKSRDEAAACIEDFDDRECQELTDQRLRVEFARVKIQPSHYQQLAISYQTRASQLVFFTGTGEGPFETTR